MQSEPNTPDVDPGEVGIAPENSEPPGRIYKQVVREVLARIDQRLAEIERQAAPPEPPGAQPRARGSFGRGLKRGFIGLLLSAGVIGATFAWQRADGGAAKAMVARWTPRFVTNALSTPDNQDATQESGAPTLRPAMADVPAAAADQTTTAEGDTQTTGSAPANQATTIEKMARDIATLTQGIEQLKASQEQMSRESAKATEQFKASEDQLIRMLLRVSEQQNPQAKPPQTTGQTRTSQASSQARTAASPPRATTTRPRQQLPTFFSRRPT